MSTLRLIRPPWWMIAASVSPLLGFLIIGLVADISLWWKYGAGGPEPSVTTQFLNQGTRSLFCCLLALMYGAFRATMFHPAYRPDYRKWLASTPWTSRLPLPLGPVHWVWQDLCFVVPATLIAWGPDSRRILAVPICFAVAYGYCITLSLFVTGERWLSYALGAAAGLGMYFTVPAITQEAALWPTVAVAVLSYPLLGWGLQRSLARFAAWDWSVLEAHLGLGPQLGGADRDEVVRRRAAKQLGWPFEALPLRRKRRSLNMAEEVVVSALAGWWLYSCQFYDQVFSMWLVMMLAAPGALAAAYCLVCRPPISWWGRLRTGRLLIPRYDRCFLWPAAMFALQWIWINMAPDLDLSLAAIVSIQLSLLVWCVLRSVAAFEAFRLTGAYRILLPLNVTLNQAAFTNA